MLYQEKIMKFLDNWEQSELDLKEKKYTENHLTNAFVGGSNCRWIGCNFKSSNTKFYQSQSRPTNRANYSKRKR